MALPPRFTGMIPGYGPMPIPPMTTIVSFPGPYFVPNPIMAAAAVNSQRLATPQVQPKMPEKPPVTTVFVGNINEKCGNELIRSMLSECGAIATWKRIQGSNGKFQAFGFCEFDSPYGTMRALRILHDYPLGNKKLVVKIDEKTRAMVKDFVARKRIEVGLTPENLKSIEMPKDEENVEEDEEVRQKIQSLIEADAPSLLPVEDGELDEKTKSPPQSRRMDRERNNRSDIKRKDKKDSDKRHRIRSHSRTPHEREKRRSRKRSASDSDRSVKKRARHRSTSSGTISSRSISSSSSETSSTSSDEESDDSVEQRERRALRKQIREKEAAYGDRLRKWEARERRQAKLYEKDERRDKQRKRDVLKEARKLKHFLEDYDDDKNDPIYYKSSSLFQRRRDFEREREADAKDRQRESQEIEELKKQIIAENKNVENVDEEARRRHVEQEEALLKKLRADSGSPNPHRPLGQKPVFADKSKDDDESDNSESDSESQGTVGEVLGEQKVNEKTNNWIAVLSEEAVATNSPNIPIVAGVSPSIRSSSLTSPCIRVSNNQETANTSSSRLNGVFGFEDNEEEDGAFRKGRKLKPFEITEELKKQITAKNNNVENVDEEARIRVKQDRIQAMTPEERKQLIKQLIDRIPTAKDQLFAFPINWVFVDKNLIEQRVKPWVSKKIVEYIGEEEASLVDFVCEKVTARTEPQKILSDIAMVLDDEAEVFVVKMWRLLIYESEANKLGLTKK